MTPDPSPVTLWHQPRERWAFKHWPLKTLRCNTERGATVELNRLQHPHKHSTCAMTLSQDAYTPTPPPPLAVHPLLEEKNGSMRAYRMCGLLANWRSSVVIANSNLRSHLGLMWIDVVFKDSSFFFCYCCCYCKCYLCMNPSQLISLKHRVRIKRHDHFASPWDARTITLSAPCFGLSPGLSILLLESGWCVNLGWSCEHWPLVLLLTLGFKGWIKRRTDFSQGACVEQREA